MTIADAIGTSDATSIDPSRPIIIGSLTLGPDAAAECVRLLGELGPSPSRSIVVPLSELITAPIYWQVERQGAKIAESFGFPTGTTGGLPTAMEMALVQALHVADEADHAAIISGGAVVLVGDVVNTSKILPIICLSKKPLSGESILYANYTTIKCTTPSDEFVTDTIIQCLQTSFNCSPIKFRLLELYRSIESRFLDDVLITINATFRSEPSVTLESALKKIKAELNQLSELATQRQDIFESIWDEVSGLLPDNTFAKALFKKLDSKGGEFKSPKWKAGAALLYYIRCAIVHAGEKDLIFENFADSGEVVEIVIPKVEGAALAFAGIAISA